MRLHFILTFLLAASVLVAQDDARKRWSEHHKNGEYEKAIEAYGEILKEDPEDTSALYNTACAYALLKEKEKAVEFLLKAVEAGSSKKH